jgi:RNAse (barnase) inhibitor barstar
MQYQIDVSRFNALEEFFEEVSRILIPGRPCVNNLDAFNDILRGDFGTPSGDFTIYWKKSRAVG